MVGITVRSRPADTQAVFDPVAPVANAILYEGYLLYPYRASSPKNKLRWQFGVLFPQAWAQAHGLDDTGVAGSAESSWQQTECLLAAPLTTRVHIRLRFLQQQRRSLECRGRDGSYAEVDRAVIAGQVELSFDEAVACDFDLTARLDELLASESVTWVNVSAAEAHEPQLDENYRVVRRRQRVAATVRLSARAEAAGTLARLRVRVDNVGDVDADVGRDEALRQAMLATHQLVAAPEGRFVSLLSPPTEATTAAGNCRNVHVFPVLADATDRIILSAPVILYDYPQVAPESPGDLHDATEIDEILSLRTLTLTDEEKAEARATDPRAAAIVDRVDAMPPEMFDRLHGAIRSLRPSSCLPEQQAPPWWTPEAEATVSPETDHVTVAGRRLSKGSRVRLRPRPHGTDVHDMFLAGRSAVVEKVLVDVDGQRHLVVTVEDDPAAELNQWYGRYRYFLPDEVEPLRGDR